MTISKQAQDLASRCSDAYSFSRYGSWPAVAQLLLSRGFNELEAEAIMRSKLMRWAGDRYGDDHTYGKYPARFIGQYLDEAVPDVPKEVRELVEGTFGAGAVVS